MLLPNLPKTDPSLEESIGDTRQKPKLIWPSAQKNIHGHYEPYDSPHCPPLIEISQQAGCEYQCLEFWDQVKATRELFIMDKYFDVSAMKHLFNVIRNRSNGALEKVHLLCSSSHSTGSDFKKLLAGIRSEYRRNRGNLEFSGDLKPGFFFDIHDRFAITDDELWHFGSTVGGVSGGLTALSRGWMDQVKAFKKVFHTAFHKARQGNNNAR